MNSKKIRELYQNFSIFPVKENKAPDVNSWMSYRDKKIDFDYILNKNKFGIVAGFENLEIIDIDNHFNDADKLFDFIADNVDLKKYLIIGTINGGYHIYYKCSEIEGNQKLASRKNDKGRPETLVETRGTGGYVVYYDNLVNGDINNVPVIDAEERSILLGVCKSLNEVERNNIKSKQAKEESTEKPGDIYNNDFASVQSTISLLKNFGWTSTDDKHWKRPGKETDGISATFGKVGVNKFYVFSSNAYPFDADTSYSMFAVKTILEFNGDYSACAKSLSPIKATTPKKKEKPADSKKNSDNKWQVLQEIIVEWDLEFRYNEITKVLDVKKDGYYQQLGLLPGDIIREMEVNRGVKSISMNKLMEMINNRTICKIYNPVKEFIDNLPKWNGKDNFKKLCGFIELHHGEKEKYFESMLKKHIVRTLKGARVTEYVNRMVLVLHGRQEIGKSWFFRWLVPAELYNEEPINPTDKDSILALTKYLIINMEELDSLNKKDVSKLKAFISRGNITKRVAYGKHDEQFNRVASFVGNTNKLDLLTDESNTRWVILRVNDFDWKQYTKEIDPLQLWAQALEMLKKDSDCGELTKEEKEEREIRNNKIFLETSQERELLVKYFEEGDTKMTATDIKLSIEKNLYPLKVNNYQLTRELKRLYGEAIRTRKNGKPGRYYMLKNNLVTAYQSTDSYYEKEKEAPF